MIRILILMLFSTTFIVTNCNNAKSQKVIFILKDSINFDNYTKFDENPCQQNYLTHNGVEYIYSFNERKKEINRLRINKDTAAIDTLKSLQNFVRQNQILSCYFYSSDSIFMISKTEPQTLYLTDATGIKLNSWDLQHVIATDYKFPFKGGLPNERITYNSKSKTIYLYRIFPMMSKNYTVEKYMSLNFVSSLNISSNTAKLNYNICPIPVSNKKNFIGGSLSTKSIQFINDKLWYSYSQNDSVFIYDNDGSCEQKLFSSKKFIPYKESYDITKEGDAEYLMNYKASGGYYHNLIYSKGSQYAYRILGHPFEMYKEDGTLNKDIRKVTICCMNINTKLVMELELNRDVDVDKMFATSKGFIIKAAKNPNKYYRYEFKNL